VGTWPVGILIAAGLVLSAAPVWGDAGAANLTDPAGDMVDGEHAAPLEVPEADILRSSILSAADGITLNVQVRKPTAPLSDKAWDGETEVEWTLETTGGGEPDFIADYYTDSGKITGDVYRSSDNDDEPVLCHLKSATFSAEAGYTAVVDPACIGAPETIAYAAEFSYDTNPDDDNAPVAEDVAPDTGVSPKVNRDQPSALPAAAPSTGPPTTTAPPTPVQAPSQGIPTATPAPSGKAPSPVPATAASPSPARRTGGGGDPAAAPGAAPEPGKGNLASTGPAHEALTSLGGAVIALGGLCVMCSARREIEQRRGLVALTDRWLSW
jgi:hypothetical protein